jgi:hypothetical protein
MRFAKYPRERPRQPRPQYKHGYRQKTERAKRLSYALRRIFLHRALAPPTPFARMALPGKRVAMRSQQPRVERFPIGYVPLILATPATILANRSGTPGYPSFTAFFNVTAGPPRYTL